VGYHISNYCSDNARVVSIVNWIVRI